MKNLLIITTSYFPINGGQESGLKDIVDEISRDNSIKVSILTQKYCKDFPDTEVEKDITIYRYKSYGIPFLWRFLPKSISHWSHILWGFLQIKSYFKKINPDYILIYFLLPSALPSLVYANKMGIPNAVFLGGSDVNENRLGLGIATKYVLKNTGNIIVTSNDIRDTVNRLYGVDKSSMIKIPYGIKLIKEDVIIRDNKVINILCVQRLVPIKSTITLIKAAKIIIDQGITNFYINIVGDGELKNDLQNLVDLLNIGDFVCFHGNIDHKHISKYYKKADIFVFPSLSEGFGIVLLEAMLYGNIIIASTGPDIPEIIKDNYNGLLFDVGDENDLAKKIIPVIINKKEYKYLSENGYKEVKNYSIENIVKRILHVLLSLKK